MSTSTTLELVVVIGAGSMGQAIARRIGVGRMILLADLTRTPPGRREDVAGSRLTTSTATVDVASHDSVSSTGRDGQ